MMQLYALKLNINFQWLVSQANSLSRHLAEQGSEHLA